jgi:flavin reductase (DIM6/NTAB) family NADH-FMN oxidoreductase RutF
MRKLWNQPDCAVWSLSTKSSSQTPNMNICTYVTAISLSPKLILIGVYKNTKTLENIYVGGQVLLQLLSEDLLSVVRVCGQRSGKNFNKIAYLQNRYELNDIQGLYYFNGAIGYSELEIEQLIETSGDHVLLVGKVLKTRYLQKAKVLTTTYLRKKRYIR